MNNSQPKTTGYCQACHNFITEGQPVALNGFYHAWCAPKRTVQPQSVTAPTPTSAPAPYWLKATAMTLLVLGGGAVALFGGTILLALCVVFPLFGFLLLWLPIAIIAQASRRAFIRSVAKEAARDGAREFVNELAKYRH